MIVPDDVWKRLSKQHKCAMKRLVHFATTHPEQHNCISPTGIAMEKLGALFGAVEHANKEEKKHS